MFIKNNTDTDLELQVKGSIFIFTANATTTIPDGIVTITELQKLFGANSVSEEVTGPSDCLMKNQMEAEPNKIYCTEGSLSIGTPRLFVGLEGKVNVYGSDSKTIPTSLDNMYLPEVNEEVSGIRTFGTLPRYIAFTVVSGDPEIILTNLNLIPVGDIS